MKKKIGWIFTILLIVSIVFSFVGCKQTVDGGEPEIPEEPIIGDGSNNDNSDKNDSSAEELDTIAPKNVSNFKVINKDASVLLTWTDAIDSDIYGYEVTWDKTGPINRTLLMAENSIMVSPKSEGCFISNLINGVEYKFTVKSVDTSGNRSSGITETIIPAIIEKSPLQIKLTPSITSITNKNVDISVDVTTETSSKVTKIVYKEGTCLNIDDVLMGTDISTTKIITVTKNTTYTVVAVDTAGRREIQWITIENIDKQPIVSNLSATYSYAKQSINVTWENPKNEFIESCEVVIKNIKTSDVITRKLNIGISSTVIENIPRDGSEYSISIQLKMNDGTTSLPQTVTVYARNQLSLKIYAEDGGWFYDPYFKGLGSELEILFYEGESVYDILERVGVFPMTNLLLDDIEYGLSYYQVQIGSNVLNCDYRYEEEALKMELYEDTIVKFMYAPYDLNVTFNLNGGKHLGQTKDIIKQVNRYTSFIDDYYLYNGDILSEEPRRDGYAFVGWTKTKDGNDFVEYLDYDSTVYAKWLEEEELSLTLNLLNTSITTSFITGDSISDVFNRLDLFEYRGYGDVIGYNNREYLVKSCKDDKGNSISVYQMFDKRMISDTTLFLELVQRYFYVTLDLNDGTYNDNTEPQYWMFFNPNASSNEVSPDGFYNHDFSERMKDGYFADGWTKTKNGTDYVTLEELENNISSDITIYAKWRGLEDILPFKYSEDGTKITFIFRPSDFGLDWSINSNYYVQLMSEATDWETDTDIGLMEKDSYGNYFVTYNYNDIVGGFGYRGFMFAEHTTGRWFSPMEYNYRDYIEYQSDGKGGWHFVVELRPYLNLDLNGGNINGDRNSISFDRDSISQFWHGYPLSNLLRELGYSEPTKDGYSFVGWTKTKDGRDFVSKYCYENITLYARWSEDNKECSLTLEPIEYSEFIDKDGNPISSYEIDFVSGMTLGTLLDSNNIPYDGVKYYSQDDNYYGLKYYIDFENNIYYYDTVLTDSVTLRPEFVLYPIVTYDFNEGYIENYSDSTYTEVAYYFSEEDIFLYSYKMDAPIRDGYVFVGWTFERDGNKFAIQGDSVLRDVRENTMVYAKYVRFTPLSSTGVYSYTVPISNISNKWGGNSSTAKFMVTLMTDEEVRSACNDSNYEVSEEDLLVNTSTKGNFYVENTNGEIIDGVAASVTETDITVFVNLEILDCSYDKKPYVIALVDKENAPDTYSFYDWADTMIMSPDAEFPSNLENQIVSNTLSYVAGTMNDWNPSGTLLVDNTFILESDGYTTIEFKFTCGTWVYSYGITDGPIVGEGYYSLGGNDNIIANLPAGRYSVTLDGSESGSRVIVQLIE